ncbi:Sulfotransferase [Planctomycetales bacterium 10988]|nr:Sulfotransferase [Planctomycetales bacterium 10988]
MSKSPPPNRRVVLPSAHFMALAPLDTWVRLLFFPLARIQPKYWLRLYTNLFTSTFATILTLPERLLFAIGFRLFPAKRHRIPGPVIVLGYYRSGTTHLQNLLDCDPQLYSPKWYQALVPQGFLLTWNLLRIVLVPFLSGKRPMDGVEVGPEYPAEDQFAVANETGACALIGRSVLPEAAQYYDRFHTLQDLTPRERKRWETSQFDFLRKVAMVAGSRRLLLKSPNHTAHVDALLQILHDVPDIKFVHITRHPHKVLRSNLAMFRIFQEVWNLQDGQSQEELEDHLVREYIQTEERYLQLKKLIPEENLIQIRTQDLQADPLGTIRNIYKKWDLPFTESFEHRLIRYLDANKGYQQNVHKPWSDEQKARLLPLIEPLIHKFGHDDPPVEKQPLPELPQPPAWKQFARKQGAYLLVLLFACLGAAIWAISASSLTSGYHEQLNRLAWPLGFGLGLVGSYATLRTSVPLGAWAAFWAAIVPIGLNLYYPVITGEAEFWGSVSGWKQLVWQMSDIITPLYLVLGVLSAYRLGSRPKRV